MFNIGILLLNTSNAPNSSAFLNPFISEAGPLHECIISQHGLLLFLPSLLCFPLNFVLEPITLRSRLAGHHEVHGGEEVLLGTGDQAVGSQGETVGGLLGAGGSESQSLEETSQAVGNSSAPGGHADNGEDIANGLDVAELTSQRPVPGEGVRAVCQILVVQHLKAGVVDGGNTLRDLAHVGDTITLLDTQSDLTVVEVVVVVVVGHEPLVNTKDTTGLEDTEDLAVDALESRGVDSSLDSVDGIKAVVRERHLLRVS